MSFAVLDSGAIAERFNLSGRLNPQAQTVFKALDRGQLSAIVPPTVLSEVYYVLRRVYDKVAVRDPQKTATDACEYIYSHPHIEIAEMHLPVLMDAGEIKHEYGIALTDCYVLAFSRNRKCKALFRHREEEMRKNLHGLERDFDLLFLEDF